MINAERPWAEGSLLAFDLETTGTDTATDRLVTAAVIAIRPGQQPVTRTWLADPGVEIPEEAAAVHGISTEHAREHGQDAASVVAEVAEALAEWGAETPLIAFRATFDLSLLHAELRRHHGREWDVAGPVVDPFCIDRAVDRYRKGKRTLSALCEHYEVRLDDAHTSAGDALATARLAWKLAKTHPDQVGTVPLATLHDQQVGWWRTQTESFADYLQRQSGKATDPAEAQRLRERAAGVREEADAWPLQRLPQPTR